MNEYTTEKNINFIDLIDNIPSGFCTFNIKSNHLIFNIWNKYMTEITGYTIEDINKIGFENILFDKHSADDSIDKSYISKCKDMECEILSKNGIKKIISINTSIFNIKNDEEIILAVVKDTTKIKKTEQEIKELREIKERYEKALELSTDSILIHNNEKHIFVNNNTFKLLNIKKSEEIIGQTIYKYIAPNFRNIVKNRITNELESKKHVPIIEESLVTSDGEVINVEVASGYVPYNGTKSTFTFIRNITYRKRLETQLRESESMLRRITENSLDLITTSDINGIITYGTPSNTYVLGYELSDFIGKNILDLVHPDDFTFIKTKFEEMKETLQEITVECRLKCKNGNYKYLEIMGKSLKNDNLIDGFIFSSRDISDRKKAEKLEHDMEENSKLLSQAAEYEKLRTDFFANLSHELRTPVNVILSSLQLLDLKTKTTNKICWSDTELKKYSEIMKQNCYRLVRLIDNLIDVTKIDAGYLNLNLINSNIVDIVENITLSVVNYVENKGISLIFDTNTEEKIIACDSSKIERIILNLISNAIKFTECGGSIFVNIIDKGENIIISVKDTGIGISQDKQKVIFDRFVQVDKSLARNREGSGIGLSLVKSLVEMHNGTIIVKSELNKGSEFIITLPNYVTSEQDNSYYSRSYLVDEHIEKINIEFSDIYY